MRRRNGFVFMVAILCASPIATAAQNVKIGVFRPSTGNWHMDVNGDNVWNSSNDLTIQWGQSGDRPVVLAPADPCHGRPKAIIAVVRPPNTWFINDNGNTSSFTYGTNPMPIPFASVGAPATIAAFENQSFRFDVNQDHTVAGDDVFSFGLAGDLPLMGIWNGAGKRMGVFRPSTKTFALDFDNSNSWTAGDIGFQFGISTDLPFAGDFNSNVPNDEVGVFRNGFWLVDLNGDHVLYDEPIATSYGVAGDIPVVSPHWFSFCHP